MSLVLGGISRRTGVRALFSSGGPGIGAGLLCEVVTRDSCLIANALYALIGNRSPL